MRTKLLHLTLVLASFVGYLEWGADQSVFLLQAEAQLFAQGISDPGSVVHPFTLLPVLGQIALVWTLFQRSPSRRLAYLGIAGIGLLFGLLLFIGATAPHPGILAGALPFSVMSIVTIRHHRRQAAQAGRGR